MQECLKVPCRNHGNNSSVYTIMYTQILSQLGDTAVHSDQLRDIAQLLYKSLATEQQESVELALPQYTSCFKEVNKPSPLTVLVRVEHWNSMTLYTHGCLECMHLPCSLSLLSYSTATYMIAHDCTLHFQCTDSKD